MTNDEYKLLKYIIRNQPIRFADFQTKFLRDEKNLYVFYSLINSDFVKIQQQQSTEISDNDLISATYDGMISFQRHASSKAGSFKEWLFHKYLGGILIGVTGTLLAEVLLLLGAKLLEIL